MKTHNIFLFLILLCLTSSLISCKKDSGKQPSLRNVILTPVSSLYNNISTTYPGIVEEGSNINASFMAEGKIGRINVKEGDRVHKGQLLAVLDDSDYKIGVSQLETQYSQMTKEKERMDAMFERHNIAPNDYEKFIAGYEQVKLQLDMVKRKLEYTRLYSPANGYIATKYLAEGELVGAGTPVFNIVDDTDLMASVDLPVSVYLNKDNVISASGSVPGVKNDIPLQSVSFTPDPDNNMLYHLKLSIPRTYSKELTPGMNISVTLNTEENKKGGAMVPSRSIVSRSDSTFVWVFNHNDSSITRKSVVIQGYPVGNLSIVEGLDGNEQIVETGVKQLYDGEKVNVVKKQDIGL